MVLSLTTIKPFDLFPEYAPKKALSTTSEAVPINNSATMKPHELTSPKPEELDDEHRLPSVLQFSQSISRNPTTPNLRNSLVLTHLNLTPTQTGQLPSKTRSRLLNFLVRWEAYQDAVGTA